MEACLEPAPTSFMPLIFYVFQLQDRHRSLANLAFHIQAPPIYFQKAMNNGKPQPCAAGFCRKKGIKNQLEVFRGYPIPRIRDMNLNKSILQILCMDMDCLLYTSPSPRDRTRSRMPSSA